MQYMQALYLLFSTFNNTGNQNSLTSTVNHHNKLFDNARFFIIKCANMDNIDISLQMGEWATTQANQRKLIEAYQQGDVILIFSVNKSGGFQGYAIMTSFISDTKSPHWNNDSGKTRRDI